MSGAALTPNVDHVGWARLLRRAHAVAIDTGSAPPIVRRLVAESWKRCAAAGVDPSKPAPWVLDSGDTVRRLTKHPVAAALSLVRELLGEATSGTGYFAA